MKNTPYNSYPSKVTSIHSDTKFLVLFSSRYSESDGYGGYSNRDYINSISFNSEDAMLEWIKKETAPGPYSSSVRDPKDILVIPFDAIKRVEVETKITTTYK